MSNSMLQRLRFSDAGFSLVDIAETYIDGRVDLLERRFRAALASAKQKPAGPFRGKVLARVDVLAKKWQEATVVRARDKFSFCVGVSNLLVTAILFGFYPDWMHVHYTLQLALLMPLRIIRFKTKGWHYFLWDFCYFCNLVLMAYLWLFPANAILFSSVFLLTMGPLAAAVITWRNSMVFHSLDHMTSLIIHIYPPIVVSVLRHRFPNPTTRFPAVVVDIPIWQAAIGASIGYLFWQGMYWLFVMESRRTQISSGSRTTSFTYLLHDKNGLIGKALNKTAPENREKYFMIGQYVYTLLTLMPTMLYWRNPMWSESFLAIIFFASCYNGASYYVEVFGRKFERELESLKKEIERSPSQSSQTDHKKTSMCDTEPDCSAEDSSDFHNISGLDFTSEPQSMTSTKTNKSNIKTD